MTGSLHRVTGGTRPDDSFATSQRQRKQSAPLVSDHKLAVPTITRLRGQPEIGLRVGPLPTKMCVLMYAVGPDEEGSDDEWLTREDRGAALTVASLRERCSAAMRRDQKRSGLMWVPTRVQLPDGLTKSSAGVFLRNALTSGTAQLHEESTKVLRRKQITSSSKEVRDVSVGPMDLEQKDWW